MKKVTEEKSADYWIESLKMTQHPEGGYFAESYRSDDQLESLPERFAGGRSASTAIYFLLEGSQVSHFHRIQSDEMWHFYTGSPLTVHVIDPMGVLFHLKIGSDPEAGEQFQGLVRAGCWFGASLEEPNGYALVGCTVAPGFDFADFELAKRDDLLSEFPEYEDTIRLLTSE
ncbi:MAG: cupin domain-containing protein [Fibrobacterales bacterium]